MREGLEPYPKYKNSEVPWLGQVPERWIELRAKYLLREVDERSLAGNEELLSVSHKTGVTPRSQKNVTMFLAKSNVGHKICRPGDLVINTMWAWMAALGISRHTGLVSPSYGVYRPTMAGKALLPKFTDELLRTELYRAEYVRRSTGVNSSRLRLYPEQFLRIPVLVPPIDEQAAIVKYLADLDRKINRYVGAKMKLIALLNEQKQAIIQRAVTRGLIPNVSLKPSGIEALGHVPVGWEVVPLKRRVGFQEGPGIMAPDFRDSGVPLLRISCLRGDVATLDGCNYLDPDTAQRRWSHFAVREGDYLLSASASTGTVVLATKAVAGAIPYTGIIRLWAMSPSVEMPFVSLFMESRSFQDQINVLKAGVAIEHFGPTHLKRMFITLPPADEQKLIAAAMKSEMAPLREAVAATRREIDLLTAFRARLVADVVTGKLDVREASTKLPDIAPEAAAVDETEDLLQDDSMAVDIEPEAEEEAA